MSCAQSLHGLLETSIFVVEDDEDFEGPTVGVVVADRFEEMTVLALEDIFEDELGGDRRFGVDKIIKMKPSRDPNIRPGP